MLDKRIYRADVEAKTNTTLFAPDVLNTRIATGWGGSTKGGQVPPPKPSAQQSADYTVYYYPPPGQNSFVSFASPSGLSVAALTEDPTKTRIVVCDTAFIHTAIDDPGQPDLPVWTQLYVRLDGDNGTNEPDKKSPARKAYEGMALQTTVCSWLDAKIPKVAQIGAPLASELRVSCNDVASYVSTDRGTTWSFNDEHWETDAVYDPANPSMPGDIAQTVHYVEPDGTIHEFAIRYLMDSDTNTPYSSAKAITLQNFEKWSGGLHKLVPAEWPAPHVTPELGNQSGLKPFNISKQLTPNEGALWRNIKANFGSPTHGTTKGNVPVWMVIDETAQVEADPAAARVPRLYVAVASNENGPAEMLGGVWYCDDPVPQIHYGSTWTRIPGTELYPYNLRLLDGGNKLLVGKSGRLEYQGSPPYDDSTLLNDYRESGVFLYKKTFDANGKETWVEDIDANGLPTVVSPAQMKSWVQDVVLDPKDPENIWYACVWYVGQDVHDPANPQGQPLPKSWGGLYRTVDAGKNWEEVFLVLGSGAHVPSIMSCTPHPDPTNPEMYICTRYDGLWYCANRGLDDLANPKPLTPPTRTEYPFRAPLRVFYVKNPPLVLSDPYQVWVASNGYGLSLLQPDRAMLRIPIGGGVWVEISGMDDLGIDAARGGGMVDAELAAQVSQVVDQVMNEVTSEAKSGDRGGRLRATLARAVETKLLNLRRQGETGSPSHQEVAPEPKRQTTKKE